MLARRMTADRLHHLPLRWFMKYAKFGDFKDIVLKMKVGSDLSSHDLFKAPLANCDRDGIAVRYNLKRRRKQLDSSVT